MATLWIVERTGNERFPFRITIEQEGRVTLALRVQEAWPGARGQVFCLREPADADRSGLEPHERVPVASLRRMGRKLSLVLDRPTRKRCDFLFLTRPYKNRPGEYEQIFFRTQSAVREHRSRGRPQLFGAPALEIVLDASERYPWTFPGARVRRQPLAVGDYALVREEEIVALVERKTFENLVGDIARVQILHQQLAELASWPHAAVVVEAQYRDFLDPKRLASRGAAPHRARVLAELSAMHPTLPIVYAGNRKLAAQWTHGFFAAVAARLDDRAPEVVAEVEAAYRPSAAGTEASIRRSILHEMPESFAVAALRARHPDVRPQTITRVLDRLRAEGRILREGHGRAARWRRVAREAEVPAKETAGDLGDEGDGR